MKFLKIEQIILRNDTKRYFSSFFNYNNYNLYFGVIKEYFSILASVDEISDDFDFFFEQVITMKYDNRIVDINPELLNNIGDKTIELFISNNKSTQHNIYIQFPISYDIIDWLKADIKVIHETGKQYHTISLPYINSILDRNIKWITDLIASKDDENILYRNPDFIISKDTVWINNKPAKTHFYILAIPTRKIKTIRELTADDIPLLEEMKNKAIDIAKSFGINTDELYFYFHYHPSYYQLHLHISLVNHPVLETKYLRHYFLDDIIDRLKLDSGYWKNATLRFEMLTNNKIYKLLTKY
jgi:hypothetical protein